MNGTNINGIAIKLVPTLGSRVIGTGIAEAVALSRLVPSTVRLLYYDDKLMTNVGKRHETPRTEQPLPQTLHPFHPFFPFVFSFFHTLNPLTFFSGSADLTTDSSPQYPLGVRLLHFLQRPKPTENNPALPLPGHQRRRISSSAARSEVFCWRKPGLVSSSSQLQIHLATLR